jgi:signal transduction histidine kinase
MPSAGRRRRAVRLAAFLGALGLGTGVAAAIVTQVADSWSYSAYDPVPLDIVIALLFSTMGALVTWHKPENRVGWAMLVIAAWDGVGVLATTLTGAFDSPDHPAVDVLMGFQQWFWAPPIWAISTLLPMIYPDGRLASRRWWWAVAATLAGILTYEIGLALADSDFAGRYTVHNPYARPEWQGFATFCLAAGEYLLLGMTVVAAAGLVLRWRVATGVRRRQISLVLIVFGFGIAQAVIRDNLPGQLPQVLDRGIEVLAFSLLPLAMAVAITRDRLFDLDLAVRRSIVGVAMIATLLACYVGGFAVLAVLLPARVVPGSVLAVALSGALIYPLAMYAIRWMRRVTWGRKIDIVEVATGLGNRMRNQLDTTEVPAAVCEEIVSAMRLRMARLEVCTADGTRSLAQVGDGDGDLPRFELWHRGEQVGRLVVCPPEGRSHLDETISQALASLADQVAPVVAALGLDEQLLRSREQLVTAREEERLRLSRELHDNVGPTLAGIRLQLEAARGALPADFAGAELMDRAVHGIQGALETLRRVVHDLRPPELDTLGLSGALKELAVFLSGPTLRVETALPGEIASLSKVVEVAAYRIVAEALTNVIRHAQATRAEISLEVGAGQLVVEVSDDGIGVPPGANRHGMGMRFMAQRAREIAGEFSYRSDGSGTAVRAVLPVLGAEASQV